MFISISVNRRGVNIMWGTDSSVAGKLKDIPGTAVSVRIIAEFIVLFSNI